MKKQEGAPVDLVFPGGQHAGTGVFHDTGNVYPTTLQAFFDRYNNGKILILPGSAVPGSGSEGVRAQVGGGEGHTEQTLSGCLMRAIEDPNNPWGVTADDMAPGRVDLTLLDFLAIYGRAGLNDAMAKYGSGPGQPGQPGGGGDLEQLRKKLADALAARDKAVAEARASAESLNPLRTELATAKKNLADALAEVAASAAGMKRAAGTKPRGQYQQALAKSAEGLEKLVAAYRQK
jgi:hypothetical protein